MWGTALGLGPATAAAPPASTLSLSWSEDSPLWDQVPLSQPPSPPKPPKKRTNPYIIPDDDEEDTSEAEAAAEAQQAAAAQAAAAQAAPAQASPKGRSGYLTTAPGSSGPASPANDPRFSPNGLPWGLDPDYLSPTPICFRGAAIATLNNRGRPPPDAAGRPLVLPTSDSLKYLDGTLPGDFGFDPLGLFDPATGSAGFLSQRWLHTAEVIHGRWAMLGAAGCLAPEYLAHEKVIPKSTGVLWFKTGFLPPAGAEYDFGVPLAVLFAVQMVLMGTVEGLRLAEYRRPGCLRGMKLLGFERLIATTQPGASAYPGGAMFNPLRLGEGRPAAMREYQQAEVRHGRLAMVAFLGYMASAAVTGRGPYDSYVLHLDEPERYNALSLLLGALGPEAGQAAAGAAQHAAAHGSGHL